MSKINSDRNFCYRLTHIKNLSLILESGIVTKNHPKACQEYIHIGNQEIIDVRSSKAVKITGYGNIGDYVPFYFTTKSIMLYNIITGYSHPLVQKRSRSEILVIRCLIEDLARTRRWFFTDGQGNDMITGHFNNLKYLNKIDWQSIQESNFSKTDGDFDRPRRYQAEFLVHEEVPLNIIESLNVYNSEAANYVNQLLKKNNINFATNIKPAYFF